MSLNWNLTGIKNYEHLCWREDGNGEKTMNPVTHSLIFATMAVDMGEITEKNWKEFWTRIFAWERIHGPYLRVKKTTWAVVDDKNYVAYDDEDIAIRGMKLIQSNGGQARVVSGEETEDRYLTPEDVYNHIGLRANVSEVSKAKYKTKIDRVMRDIADRHLRAFEEPKAGVEAMSESVRKGGES